MACSRSSLFTGVFVLLFLWTLVVLCLSSFSISNRSRRRDVEKQGQCTGCQQQQVKVLIYSRARSGSSFLGSLFAQSPDVTYFYEPLWKQQALLNRTIAQTTAAAPGELSMLFNCNMSASWAAEFRLEMLLLIRSDKAGMFLQQIFNELNSNKQQVTNEELQQRVSGHCRNHSHVVMKYIDRLQSLELIEPLWDDRFFVLYLVRDPRAVSMSRSVVNNSLGTALNMSLDFLCGSALVDIAFLKEKSSASMKNNILIVRYEDLTNDLFGMIRILFGFVHLPIHSRVTTWINAISKTRMNKTEFSVKQDPFHVVAVAQRNERHNARERSEQLLLPQLHGTLWLYSSTTQSVTRSSHSLSSNVVQR